MTVIASEREQRRAFARNGLPREPDRSEPLPKRLLKSKFFWLTVVMLLVYATALFLLYRLVVPDQEVPGGVVPGLGTEALPIAANGSTVLGSNGTAVMTVSHCTSRQLRSGRASRSRA